MIRPGPRDILKPLEEFYKEKPGYLYFDGLSLPTGLDLIASETLEGWVINTSNYTCSAFESVISRSEFLKQADKLRKRQQAFLWSNLFYFVAPKNIIKLEDLPIYAGLIEVQFLETELGEIKYEFSIVVDAVWRDTQPPSWSLLVEVARRVELQERLSK
jgi:hypothetical protein